MGAPHVSGSDDDRANLMWKRYLEREDSKIVGMARAQRRGSRGAGSGGRGAPSRGAGARPGDARVEEAEAGLTVNFSPPLCFCLDLFVGQLKSCLKCQACGYRSTTFEVFCDLSLPIPKVGFQRVPGVDGTCGFVTQHHPALAWGAPPASQEQNGSLSWEEEWRMPDPALPFPPERVCWGQGVSAGLFQPVHQGRRAGAGECPSMWASQGYSKGGGPGGLRMGTGLRDAFVWGMLVWVCVGVSGVP